MVQFQLCGTTDVKRVLDYTGRWTGTQVSDRITEESNYIYQECGYPIAGFVSDIEKDGNSAFYKKFYIGEAHVSAVDRVWVGTTVKRELSGGTDYSVNIIKGIIELTGTTIAGQDLDVDEELTCWYVPEIYSKYCALLVVRTMLEESDIVSGETASNNLTIINNKIDRIEKIIGSKIGILDASNYLNHDGVYDTVVKKIDQDFERNSVLDDHVTSSGVIPYQDKVTYNGTACTGSTGTVNRTLEHYKNLTDGNQVIVNGLTLVEDTDYTKSGSVITFLIAIYDTDKIVVYT